MKGNWRVHESTLSGRLNARGKFLLVSVGKKINLKTSQRREADILLTKHKGERFHDLAKN